MNNGRERYELHYCLKNHFWFKHRNRVLLREIRHIYPSAENLRILDVGSGSGILCNYLAEADYSVDASDLKIEALKFCSEKVKNRDRLDIEGTIPSCREEKYDIVVMADVLEHVKASRALMNVKKILKTGGRLILTVPALERLRIPEEGHDRRYAKPDLRRELSAAGFDEITVKYFMFLPAVILFLSRKILARGAKRRISYDREMERSYKVNFLMNWAMKLEYALTRRLGAPFGSSLIATTRKSNRVPCK